MTKLYDGQIADLLRNPGRYNPEIMALSYALLQEKRRIMDAADRTRTMAMIDQLPGNILDVLAVELRSPYYSGDMPIEKKREIIKNTLAWFSKAGTPAALEEFITIIFGQGKVVEWFDFTEPPYTPGTFDIITDTRMTEGIVEGFLQIIRRVKNTRSHLRRVLVERTGVMRETIGSGAVSAPKTYVLNGGLDLDREISTPQRVKAGTVSAPKERVLNHAPAKDRGAGGSVSVGTSATSAPHEMIGNHAPERARTESGIVRAGAVLVVRDIHIIIANRAPPDAAATANPNKTV